LNYIENDKKTNQQNLEKKNDLKIDEIVEVASTITSTIPSADNKSIQ